MVGSPHCLTVSRTEDGILDDDDGTSISSTKCIEMKMLSDDDSSFNLSKVNIESSSRNHDEADIRQEDPLFLMTMITKKDFKDKAHVKSGKYYLPKAPPFNKEGRKSELYANQSIMAHLYPCGAPYQIES